MTEATAIQKDVVNEQENKLDEPVNANIARGGIISQIAANARKERDEYLEQNGETVSEKSTDADTGSDQQNDDKENNTDEQNTSGEIDGQAEQHIEQKPKTVKIKVDGEEREVPEDKILDAGIRALQKESAADKRLEEATRLLKEAKEYVKPQKEEEALPQEWDDATIAYAFQHGNDEQKAYAVSLLRGRENTIQPDQIAQHVTQKVLDTVDFNNASTWFQNEYKDIVGDPLLFHLAAVSEDKARAEGDKRPRQELYKEIGDNLRKWKGTEVKTNQDALKTKQEKKSAAATNIPSASSVKKETKQESPTKTPQEIIAEMRKKRGQYT